MTRRDETEQTSDRRRLLKAAIAGGSVAAVSVPERWVKPVIQAVIVPAHAETSPSTTTTTSTTTARPTTTRQGTTTAAPTTTAAATTTVAPTTAAPTTTAVPTTTVTTTTTTTTTAAPVFNVSDARLKRDVVRVARLASGIVLYRFRYLWSEVEYVGVMAQEVLAIVPQAVRLGPDGYYRVDYAALGLEMTTADAWLGGQPAVAA